MLTKRNHPEKVEKDELRLKVKKHNLLNWKRTLQSAINNKEKESDHEDNFSQYQQNSFEKNDQRPFLLTFNAE